MPFPRAMASSTISMRRQDSGISLNGDNGVLCDSISGNIPQSSATISSNVHNDIVYSKSMGSYTDPDERHPGMIRFLSEDVPADIIGHLAFVMHNIWETNRPIDVLRQYIARMTVDMEVDYTVVIASVIYLQKLKVKFAKSRIDTSKVSTRQMFLAAVLIASKYFCDVPFSNSQWAQSAKVDLAHINTLEKETLVALEYNLHIEPELHRKVKKYFERVMHQQNIAREQKILNLNRKRSELCLERPVVTASGIKRKPNNYLSCSNLSTSPNSPVMYTESETGRSVSTHTATPRYMTEGVLDEPSRKRSSPTKIVDHDHDPQIHSNSSDQLTSASHKTIEKRKSIRSASMSSSTCSTAFISSVTAPLKAMPLPPLPMSMAEAAVQATRRGMYIPRNMTSNGRKRPVFPASKLGEITSIPVRMPVSALVPVSELSSTTTIFRDSSVGIDISESAHPSKTTSLEHCALGAEIEEAPTGEQLENFMTTKQPIDWAMKDGDTLPYSYNYDAPGSNSDCTQVSEEQYMADATPMGIKPNTSRPFNIENPLAIMKKHTTYTRANVSVQHPKQNDSDVMSMGQLDPYAPTKGVYRVGSSVAQSAVDYIGIGTLI
ncbi:hypothetical protein SARC_04016 [Sphaeroforma arctica JP610]|uniref:Cyclin N-terminal domain-containing protein n=1 Tax=Sphaeroforma arctica JP610 TaxID=667725 RepID=A0A0L0G3Q2_9EUKA|nr:hypothetical protein SARC_04016 [Sphaeroforma arctica JP610]KNC83737.1 hypothetical protein SARC_04016 [Sphaeroforma arctica JP610]|eukprot:XP_014157639.1 hypothetical protein SARC_04016 [Sphaeroforma arctica JP610]